MNPSESPAPEVKSRLKFALNGLSIDTLTLKQDGELEVEFDLPHPQTTPQYVVNLKGSRAFDIYEDRELLDACKHLFDVVRDRVMQPDPDRIDVHCDTCATSACCRKYNALVTEEDVERAAPAIGVTPEDFRKRYTVDPVDWSGDYCGQLACDNDDEGKEKCVFLKRVEGGGFRCSIYEHRPEICRDFDMTSCDDYEPFEKLTDDASDEKRSQATVDSSCQSST